MIHRPIIGAFLICLACLLALTSQMTHAQSTQPDVVISQLYGGGGNSGAVYTHDFIELFNRGQRPVSLVGWSVQYASATGTVWKKTELSGTIQPGRYYLIQQAQGSRGTRRLPKPDAIGVVPMSSRSGKVALLTTGELLPRGTDCPSGPALVDLVGFGNTDCYAGSRAAPKLDNKTANVRAWNGCTDSKTNGNDFVAERPTPRNSATSPTLCNSPSPSGLSPAITQIWEPPTATARLILPSAQPTPTVQIISDTAPTRLPVSVIVSQTKHLVISQIYGGGGNAGALYTHDFVELYNATSVTVELNGWSLQYASATGKTWLVTTLTGTIAPGDAYLIRQAQGTGGRISLPNADATGETAMSASRGKVALVNGVDPLTGSCPQGEQIEDFVGYGRANCFEGEGPAARSSNTRALHRTGSSAQDTNDNSADFVPEPPTPRRK